MATALVPDMKSFADTLCERHCWYVSVGGCTLPSFQLALGKKIRRTRLIQNTLHTQEYREFEWEYGLLVWCSWRLDSPGGPVTSSDDTEESICQGLYRLRGMKVIAASTRGPGWDLRLRFSNRLTLRIFCDHVRGDPGFNTNWELWQREQCLEVAAGSRIELSTK